MVHYLSSIILNDPPSNPTRNIAARGRNNRLFLTFVLVVIFVESVHILPLFSPPVPLLSPQTPDTSQSRSINSTMPMDAIKQQSSSPGLSSESCAICFFGLPRSFKRLVLPSIVRNILLPNQHHACDVYVHYYQLETEAKGRGPNQGGPLSTEDILLLKPAVEELTTTITTPHLGIATDNNATFWEKRGDLLHKYRTTRDPHDDQHRWLYFPWNAKTYQYPSSIDNIAMQWHSIQSVWEEMERGERLLHKNYTRVAMLRSDVFYMTPFDLFRLDATSQQDMSQVVAIPNWAKYPVNDRMIYGAKRGVQIWATERFDRLEDHVRTYQYRGYGMHSERFLAHSILPAIVEHGIPVMTNPEICFFRTRASGSIWINDCATRAGAAKGYRRQSGNQTKSIIHNITGIDCPLEKLTKKIISAQCGT